MVIPPPHSVVSPTNDPAEIYTSSPTPTGYSIICSVSTTGGQVDPVANHIRAYRACLNCRIRKSKCVLERGSVPCRRCRREARDCVLGGNRRGGRRVRRRRTVEDDATSSGTGTIQAPTLPINTGQQPSLPLSIGCPNETSLVSSHAWHNLNLSSMTESATFSRDRELADHANIESPNLQNPSDALDILANVAEKECLDGQQQGEHADQSRHAPGTQKPSAPKTDDQLYYKPVQDGLMTSQMVYRLFSIYGELFHPYFPITPRETLDQARLPWVSRYEPHLFAAILTIASKDNEQVHRVCYDHMQQLISMVMAGSSATVEAVEALLLLSQWVSHRPQTGLRVGRGEEDRVAWMYIGTALRLGYFLGIDQASFKSDSQEDMAMLNRKRLAWLACYICDRQVSVRLGKGFWARGPGPLSGLKSDDFPSLQPQSLNEDNWALIFQANIELTQIFSNAHDILYSLKEDGVKEMLEGRYAKYLDDFRTAIRSWNNVWGMLICSAPLKASLLLTYDYLRLYVNAFAYQATLSRALIFESDTKLPPNWPLPLINPSSPDARFIYEAIDAAKSLLSTFNNFIEPKTLRHMPSSYYLFIIYSAVFLYKAKSITAMAYEEQTGIGYMIDQTINRLQMASTGKNHMGSRYARLLQLLWRKIPTPADYHKALQSGPMEDSLKQLDPVASSPSPWFDQSQGSVGEVSFVPSDTFSWLDLGATWSFATQNNNMNESLLDDDMVDTGPNLLDTTLLSDYSNLEGDSSNLVF